VGIVIRQGSRGQGVDSQRRQSFLYFP